MQTFSNQNFKLTHYLLIMNYLGSFRIFIDTPKVILILFKTNRILKKVSSASYFGSNYGV